MLYVQQLLRSRNPQTQKIVPYILVTRFELQILTSLYQNLSLHEEEVIYFHQLRLHSSKIFMSYHSKLTREIKKKLIKQARNEKHANIQSVSALVGTEGALSWSNALKSSFTRLYTIVGLVSVLVWPVFQAFFSSYKARKFQRGLMKEISPHNIVIQTKTRSPIFNSRPIYYYNLADHNKTICAFCRCTMNQLSFALLKEKYWESNPWLSLFHMELPNHLMCINSMGKFQPLLLLEQQNYIFLFKEKKKKKRVVTQSFYWHQQQMTCQKEVVLLNYFYNFSSLKVLLLRLARSLFGHSAALYLFCVRSLQGLLPYPITQRTNQLSQQTHQSS